MYLWIHDNGDQQSFHQLLQPWDEGAVQDPSLGEPWRPSTPFCFNPPRPLLPLDIGVVGTLHVHVYRQAGAHHRTQR